jgi:hypothetical protein
VECLFDHPRMSALPAQADDPLQKKQIGKAVTCEFGDELLAFPTAELAVFNFEQPTDFLAGVIPTRLALNG